MHDVSTSVDAAPRLSRRRPLVLLATAFGLTAVLLVALLLESNWSYRTSSAIRSEYLPAERLAGEVSHYDEILTMSARMAAATGDFRWERRYSNNAQRLDRSISETRALGEAGLFPLEGLDQIDGAYAALQEMDDDALDFVLAGRPQEAVAILSSEDYRRNKLRYGAGIEILTRDMQDAIDRRLADNARRSRWSATIAVAVLLVSLGTWLLLWRSAGSWDRRAELTERERRLLRERDRERLAETEMMFDQLVQNAPVIIYAIDREGTFTSIAGRGLDHFQIGPERLLGRSIFYAMRDHPALLDAIRATLDDRPAGAPVNTDTGSFSTVHVPLRRNGEIDGVVGIATDVTEQAKLERELRHRSHHDALTGLCNRDRFRTELERAVGRGAPIGLLLVDIDGFTEINDTRGHLAGDRLLVAVARRLTAIVGERGQVARLGGDEFAVLLPRADSDRTIADLADRILDAVRAPFTDLSGVLDVSASIGTIGPVDGRSQPAEQILADADLALNEAKDNGGDQATPFADRLRVDFLHRVQLRKELDAAIAENQFQVDFQPVWDLDTGRIHGVEALVRWNHPERGLLPPGEFLPLAEQTGQITDIDLIVFETACRQLATWRRTNERWAREMVVAVNVSALDFSRVDLAAVAADLVERHDVDPSRLVVELTETAVMDNTDAAKATLARLGALGFQVALDDFGTGYSSLSQLQALDINVLKIDRSFVSGADLTTMTLAETIVGLGRSLRLHLVAEGIETIEQLSDLKRFGCHFAQGFLLARPMSAADVAATARATERSGHAMIVEAPSDTRLTPVSTDRVQPG